MAIGSEVFGGCVGEIDVSVGVENRDAWLCYGRKYLRFVLGVKSGSLSAVEVRDGSRYWRLIEARWASLKK